MSELLSKWSHLLALVFVASSRRGLIPRLLGDIISLWLCYSLAYLVNTYALDSGVGWAPDEMCWCWLHGPRLAARLALQ